MDTEIRWGVLKFRPQTLGGEQSQIESKTAHESAAADLRLKVLG